MSAPAQQTDNSPAPAARATPEAGGGRLLLSDIRVALLLAQEARYKAMEQLFGLSREQANIASLVAALTAAQAIQDALRRAVKAPGAPSPADSLLALAGLRELGFRVAGPTSRDTPLFGTLLAIAVIGGAARPGMGRALRGLSAGSHRLNVGFRHRYGYLVDPGHWRARRARRRSAERPIDLPA